MLTPAQLAENPENRKEDHLAIGSDTTVSLDDYFFFSSILMNKLQLHGISSCRQLFAKI
jgi:hypothetical protein